MRKGEIRNSKIEIRQAVSPDSVCCRISDFEIRFLLFAPEESQ